MSLRIFWSAGYWSLCGLWLVFVLIAATRPAHAYVDPGSGLLFIQAAGSTLAGIGYLLRRRIRDFFRRLTGRSEVS
jgi:hypothetical protein